jgi:hypothetical protein
MASAWHSIAVMPTITPYGDHYVLIAGPITPLLWVPFIEFEL